MHMCYFQVIPENIIKTYFQGTDTCSQGFPLLNFHDRTLTLREAARLQSFPDYFQFVGKSLSIGQQIGNAFPPLVAKILAHHLMTIDGYAGSDVSSNDETIGALDGFHLTDALGMSPALAKTNALLERLMKQQTQPDLLYAQES